MWALGGLGRRVLPDGCPASNALRRATLRRAAHEYAVHGWAVVPGACLRGDRFTCGTGCRTVGCHPAAAAWEETATTRLVDIDSRWRRRAWSVLLATGREFDVVDAPAYLGAI